MELLIDYIMTVLAVERNTHPLDTVDLNVVVVTVVGTSTGSTKPSPHKEIHSSEASKQSETYNKTQLIVIDKLKNVLVGLT